MSYGSETPHVWSSSSGSEVSPYGPLWDAPPASVPYPDILGFPPADLVNRVRLINHSSYAISVVQETMYGVEKFGFCNLKVEEVTINLNQTILGKRVLGEAKLKNGFLTTIESLDVISSTVQQEWLSAVPGTVEVRSTLRLINMELGFDVETKISDEKYLSSAVILYPETLFAFNISKNLFTDTISVSVFHTMINPRTTLRLLPKNNVSELLPPLYDWNCISNSVSRWASEIFRPITQNLVDKVIPFPTICYDCPVSLLQ